MKSLERRIAALSPEQRELLERKLGSPPEQAIAPGVPRRPDDGPAPLSFAQERLWFHDRSSPGDPSYNLATVLDVTGPLDRGALAAALRAVARRQEVLSTVYRQDDAVPLQAVAASARPTLSVVDLREVTAPAAGVIAAAVRRFVEAPFDLERGPVLRALVVDRGDGRQRLALAVHHIAFDFSSVGLLVDELVAFYRQELSGVAAALPTLPVQYADFAAWQRRHLAGGALAEQVAWWKERLRGAPKELSLPVDRPRPAEPSSRGAAVPVSIAPEVLDALEALGRRRGASLFMTVLAAFGVLLGRTAAVDDLVIGSPVGNRSHEELRQLIGFFVNMLGLRLDLSRRPTVGEAVARARETVLGAQAHGDVPFETLVRSMSPERSTAVHPVFQVILTLQQRSEERAEPAGLRIERVPLEIRVAKFDLTLALVPSRAGLRGALEYRADLFDATTARRLAERFERLTGVFAAEPDTPVGDLPLLSAAERAALLHEWRSPEAFPDEPPRLEEMLSRQVAERPDAVAVSCGAIAISYRELAVRTEGIARWLRRSGLGIEDRVGISMGRSLDLVVALLGVLRAGAAYVPLDPAYPVERQELIARDAGLSALVVDAGAEPAVNGLPTLWLGAGRTGTETEDDGRPSQDRFPPDGLAYLIYTSGSTGTPKGVEVTRRNVARLIEVTRRRLAYGPADAWSLFHSYAFDVSVWEIFGALLTGGRVVVVPEEVRRSPEDFHALLERQRVTMLSETPSGFRELVRLPLAPPFAIRGVVFGGEELRMDLVAPWIEAGGAYPPRLINMYGITETTVHVTWRRIDPPDLETPWASPIGPPMPDLDLVLLDPEGRLVPTGTPGEIFVGGEGLARGYHGRPGLTAERFVPDPWFGRPGARLYRSGDLARYRANGDLVYGGRIDHQVKVRGFRIEPGEIEAALVAHPAVEAVVVALHEADEVRRLVAYLTLIDGAEDPGVSAWRSHLAERLPEHMIPAWFMVLGALPKTPSGKVDRRALPEPEAPRGSARGDVAPRTPEEVALAGIWAELLRTERVGVHDNFFELGGDSILSIQVVSRARRVGLRITPRALFHHPTIAGLARVAERETEDTRTAERFRPGDTVPMTPVQRRFFELEVPSPHHYNQALLLASVDAIAPDRLGRAVSRVVAHHPVLSARFEESSDGPVQRMGTGSAAGAWGTVDLSGLAPDARRRALAAAAARAQASLDPPEGRLLRVVGFELGPGEGARLLWVIHHLVVDGVSWRILLEDLAAAYDGEELPAPTTPAGRWAEALERAPWAAAEREHWLGLPWESVRPLPGSGQRGRVGDAETVSVALGEEETRELLGPAGEAYRTRPEEILLAAVGTALEGWAGGAVIVEVEGHGREEGELPGMDLSRTVGWFTTVYPVVLHPGGEAADGDWGRRLLRVKESLRSVPSRGLGWNVLRFVHRDPEIVALPEGEVSFNYLGQLDQALASGGRFAPAPEPSGKTQAAEQPRRYRLDVTAAVTGGRLRLRWLFAPGTDGRERVEALAAGALDALRALLAHLRDPRHRGSSPSDFPLSDVDQATIDRLEERLGPLEDLYPLSPLQQGLLFHTLEDRGAAVYVQQLSGILRGALDAEAFAAAWARVIERHTVLRTAFVWRDLEEPLQAVLREAEMPLDRRDWSGQPAAEAALRARSWLADDARVPFVPDAVPLMRLGIAALPDGTHLFRWTHHHLLLDGWSMVRLLQEVLDRYGTLVAGAEPDPEPAPPFRDYVAWLAGRDAGAAEAHWREALEGFTEPALLARPLEAEGPSTEYHELTEQLSEPIGRALAETARRERVTVNTVAEAAWALLLARTLGRRDVLFGTVSAGRPAELAGVEEMLGVFINTLPLRVATPPEAPVADWLRERQAETVEHRAFEHAPLVEIHRWSPVPETVPLFDTLFDFTNYPVARALGERRFALEVEGVRFLERTNYPISLNVVPGERPRMRLTWRADALERSAAARLLRRYRTLLGELATRADARLGELEWLTAAERHQVVREWNDTAVARPGGTLHGLVSARAASNPDAVAGVYEGAHLSYGELLRRSGALAGRLRRAGVGVESRVGVALERSLELLVGLMGILESGAAYVPLDPDYPAERLRFMAEDAGLSALLALPGDSAPEAPGVVRLDPSSHGEAADPGRSEPPESAAAYVIYTSGSTGRPKGVAVPHRGIVNRVRWMASALPLDGSDRVLHKTPLSFDVSVAELFWPLASGACLVIARPGGHKDPRYLGRVMAGERVTALHFVPSMLRVFLDGAGATEVASLRQVVASGEALPRDLAAGLGRLSEAPLYNLYGPTEASVDVTCWRVDPAEEPVPIGRPIDGVAVRVLDERGEPAPIGVAGELALGGVALARGYVGRPALTAERFVPDPFGEPGARLYLTGDRARTRADGAVDFLGRLDGQVKLRGLRVELGEIEARLAEDPALAAAVVTVGAWEGGSLVAYVVSTDGGPVDRDAVRARLAENLPDFMVPRVFVELAALPLTPSGKVDRRALPSPEAPDDTPERPPGTPLEAKVAKVWQDLLGRPVPGVDRTFFELGGNSLLAMRLVSRLREATGVELPLRAVVERPTVAGMAAAVEESAAGPGGEAGLSGLSPIVPDPENRHRPFPLNDVQQAYWVGRRDLFELGNVSSHFYVELEIDGLDLARFEAALRRVIDRHDMLRAVIADDGSQRVLPEVPPYELPVVDLADATEEERERRVAEVREELSHQVLPADRWPLFDIRASRLGGDKVRLHVSVDVLITDAWSSQILARDLARYYADPEAELPPLELTFRDYVLGEVELRESALYRRSLDYWTRRLETLPPGPDLPLARRPGSLERPRFTRRDGRLEPGRWRALQERAAAAGLTASGALLAAFAEVLTLWSRSPRFTLDLTLFNRLPRHPQVEEIVGDFTSVTLLEIDGEGETFAERARAVQDRLWEDLDHRYAGGIRVLRELARVRGRSSGALMPVVFTSTLGQRPRSGRPRPTDGGEVRSRVVYSVSQTPQVWLDHQVFEGADGGLGYHWDAVDELFPKHLVDDLLDAYRGLLGDLADGDEAWRRRHLPVPESHREVQRRINATERSFPTGLLHAPAEAAMRERPEAVAVVTTQRRLRYRDVDRMSAALARRLVAAGARPNTLVALVMEKGWEQVVGALAVVRAGAAYLPIEASLPVRRRDHLLERGEVEIVLTQPRVALAESWPDGLTVIEVSDGAADEDPGAEAPPPERAEPGDLAYVIFTSGSTGEPKGVAIDHEAARNTIEDVNRRFGVGPEDRVLGLSAMGFDLSVWDLFGTLGAGGTLVLPEPGWTRDPGALFSLTSREGVTVWNSVPALMAMLVEHSRARERARLPALRLVLLSGDWIPLDLPDAVRTLAPGAEVISLGGATEASIWSILHPIGELDPAWPSIPYGRPMANQRFEVLDARMEPRPFWVPGELYIGGVGLARGYWRDPERTAASFVEHPRTGERLYRTGDHGRWHPDGTLEFLGRQDLQVKIRGHRIELGEIEAALEDHPSVRSAVVVVAGDDRRHGRLIGFVVPVEGAGESAPQPEEDPPPEGVRWPRGPAVGAPAPDPGRSLDPASGIDVLEHKLSQPGRRRGLDERESVELPRPTLDACSAQLYLDRRTDRSFRREPIGRVRLGRFLAALSQVEIEDMALPKYAYPSAGSLYPVQCYLHLRDGAVDGMAEGCYYFDPAAHRLVLLSAGPLDPSVHTAVNAPVYESAGFTLFLVARPKAVEPLYGAASRDLCLLEAGYMGQLLMTAGPPLGVGLCPLGSLDFGAVRHRLELEDDQWLVHSLIGGAVAPRRTGGVPAPGRGGADDAGEGPDGLTGALEEHLAARLPEYMVPGEIVLLDALPLTANGKVDRNALADRAPAAGAAAGGGPEPRDALETALAEIWAELLGHEPVGVHDNFFQLGGDSVLAIRAVNRARERGLEVETRDLFELQTVAELATRIRGSGPPPSDRLGPGEPPPGEGEEETPFGLSGLDTDALAALRRKHGKDPDER